MIASFKIMWLKPTIEWHRLNWNDATTVVVIGAFIAYLIFRCEKKR
jgi:uncharacterized membrane protein